MALDKITTNIIEDDAITAAKIVAGAVEVDIRAGSVTGDKIGYLGDGTGNLSGTIANQQLHFGSAFTLTDNLTVNGDLTLGKVRDDGLGQSLTGSGRTLSGTGTLTMGSSVERADRVTSVNGMTGTLGSGVTGGSGLTALGTVASGNLSNTAIVYPAGHIIKVTTHSSTFAIATSSAAEALESDATDITVACTAGNKLHITIAGGHIYASGANFYFGAGMQITESGVDVDVFGGGCYQRSDGGNYDNDMLPSIIYTHTAVTTSVTIKAATRCSASGTAYWEATNSAGRGPRRYMIQEEQA
jgi:hypothetical protein